MDLDWAVIWTAIAAVGNISLAFAAFITLKANSRTTVHLQEQVRLMEEQAKLAAQQNELLARQVASEQRRDTKEKAAKLIDQYKAARARSATASTQEQTPQSHE